MKEREGKREGKEQEQEKEMTREKQSGYVFWELEKEVDNYVGYGWSLPISNESYNQWGYNFT